MGVCAAMTGRDERGMLCAVKSGQQTSSRHWMLCISCVWEGLSREEALALCVLISNAQLGICTRIISIHPQINSKEVLRFTAALSAATREKGGCLYLPFLLNPLLFLSLPLADNYVDFSAALVLCCSGKRNGLTNL